MDQKGRPIRAIIRASTTADYCQAEALRPGIQAQYLLADRGYDSQAILQQANQAEIQPVVQYISVCHCCEYNGKCDHS